MKRNNKEEIKLLLKYGKQIEEAKRQLVLDCQNFYKEEAREEAKREEEEKARETRKAIKQDFKNFLLWEEAQNGNI